MSSQPGQVSDSQFASQVGRFTNDQVIDWVNASSVLRVKANAVDLRNAFRDLAAAEHWTGSDLLLLTDGILNQAAEGRAPSLFGAANALNRARVLDGIRSAASGAQGAAAASEGSADGSTANPACEWATDVRVDVVQTTAAAASALKDRLKSNAGAKWNSDWDAVATTAVNDAVKTSFSNAARNLQRSAVLYRSTVILAILTIGLFLTDIVYVEFYLSSSSTWSDGSGAEVVTIKGLEPNGYVTSFTSNAYNLDAVIIGAAGVDILLPWLVNFVFSRVIRKGKSLPSLVSFFQETFFTVFTICTIALRIGIAPLAISTSNGLSETYSSAIAILGVIVAFLNLLFSVALFTWVPKL